jgi:hypothetical protein
MSNGEQNTKIAIVVDGALPPGLAANTAAVLAMSLGRRLAELIGADLKDGDGSVHPGITNTPIPILTAPADRVKDIRARAASDDDLFIVDFTDRAQQSKTYDDYADLLRDATSESLAYLGVALYGPRKPVQRLTGSLPLLR